MRPEAPELLANFVLTETLAVGGAATVWRAHEVNTGLPVALKRLHPALAHVAEVRDAFAHECLLLKTLGAPHVPQWLAQDTECSLPWVAMQFCEAKSWSDESLSLHDEPTLCVRMMALCDALEALHTLRDAQGPLGAVHRDLCPANVLVSESHVVLVDLGLATSRLRPRGPDALSHATLGYASPERYTGEGPLDLRADLWALGVMAWQSLAQKRLYVGDKFGVAGAIVDHPVPDVRVQNSSVSEAMSELIASLVARDVHARPASAIAVREALARVLRG
ncbi:MAG: serine/threonine-protein kinase [Deltaproteobacteria bacterium]|nr:serine/threonine-protein kinase [Deltaproteobacteria bacterium]